MISYFLYAYLIETNLIIYICTVTLDKLLQNANKVCHSSVFI